MKHSVLFPLLAAGAALLIAGCGKSAEFKKLESDLFASLATLHDEGMALMGKGSDLSAMINDAIATYDSLAAKYPKEFTGQSTDDLIAAKEKLANARASMKGWMAGMKPYDPTMDHTEAMEQLSKAKEGITKVNADYHDAISAATTAIENHRAFAEELTAKQARTMKKAARK